MKNKLYYLVASTMLLNVAHAEDHNGTQKASSIKSAQEVTVKDTATEERFTLLPGPNDNAPQRAEGQAKPNAFLQDVCVYTIAGEKKVAMAYVSGKAASDIGYNGFKVGDRVTWMPMVDMNDTASNGFENRYFTGKIDMLDSDKCYIKIDKTNKIAVKLYEDIRRLNP